MAERDHLFQALVAEAVLACGTDVAAIERHVHARLGAMSEAERAEVDRDIARVLGFREPHSPPYKPS